jgi:adenosine deaminase
LRTTPREIPKAGISREEYVCIVLQTIAAFTSSPQNSQDKLHTKLILSIDRKNTLAEAMEVVALATKYATQGIVGIDLCGNPTRQPISHLSPAFTAATAQNIPLTLHFAEIPQDGTEELDLMLSWQPKRLGHAIHIPSSLKPVIAQRGLGLELCLSCNVLCNLTQGGYSNHHFGGWWREGGKIALSTDDVGIFERGSSEEYALAAEHFGLGKGQLVKLSRGAVDVIFGGEGEKERMRVLLDGFEGERLVGEVV